MNAISITFLSINSIALLLLPRRWAPLPLLLGACYMTLGQEIEIGPFHFTVIRILILAGVVRIFLRRERLTGGMNSIDWLMLIWCCWALFSSLFHKDPNSALIFRLGLAYNTFGVYLLIRIFFQSIDDAYLLCKVIAILLIPVAIEMVYENLAFHNLFSVLGGVPEVPQIREGRTRSFGPFMHPILAGTVGAVCFPLMIGLWQKDRKLAFAGGAACLAIIITSASSGPVMSLIAGTGALFMWYWRHRIRLIRWLAVIGYIGLEVVMKAPAYFLIARIDLAGGSTGWHRAELIDSSVRHLNEWWIAGTDYTLHWMPTGVSWSPEHTDITNHYIYLGVVGGLPLMLLFIAILVKGFSFIGKALQESDATNLENLFFIWTLGASLFAHASTCVAVSYFDQSFVFLYLTLAAIAAVRTIGAIAKSENGVGADVYEASHS